MSEDKIKKIRARYAGYSLNSGNAGKANEDRGWLLAEVDKLGAENEKLRAEIERLREVIRTIRARCVELDDSDAVSETLDIATAVLEDEP